MCSPHALLLGRTNTSVCCHDHMCTTLVLHSALGHEQWQCNVPMLFEISQVNGNSDCRCAYMGGTGVPIITYSDKDTAVFLNN